MIEIVLNGYAFWTWRGNIAVEKNWGYKTRIERIPTSQILSDRSIQEPISDFTILLLLEFFYYSECFGLKRVQGTSSGWEDSMDRLFLTIEWI